MAISAREIKGLALLAILTGALFWLRSCEGRKTVVEKGVPLPSNVRERVSYNPKTHTLLTQTASGAISQFAYNPSLDLKNDGSFVIKRNLTGFKFAPFFGAGYSDSLRLFVGDDFYHVGRFNFNGSLGATNDRSKTLIKSYAGMGYNIWSNTSLDIALNPFGIIIRDLDVAGFVSVEF